MHVVDEMEKILSDLRKANPDIHRPDRWIEGCCFSRLANGAAKRRRKYG